MAVIDGIQNKISPGEPLDKDIYDLAPEELAEVPKTPGSLDEALAALRTRSRVPAARRRVHARRDRHLDLVQDREGSRRDAAAAASVRVLLVLRYLNRALRVGSRHIFGRPADIPHTTARCRTGALTPDGLGHAGYEKVPGTVSPPRSDRMLHESFKSYGWIKVPKYVMDESKTWAERYRQFEEPHIAETTFLIDKVRELAKAIEELIPK